MGRVVDVVINSNNEVTGAKILKGATREIVKRHVTTIIPLLNARFTEIPIKDSSTDTEVRTVKSRQAALVSRKKTAKKLQS